MKSRETVTKIMIMWLLLSFSSLPTGLFWKIFWPDKHKIKLVWPNLWSISTEQQNFIAILVPITIRSHNWQCLPIYCASWRAANVLQRFTVQVKVMIRVKVKKCEQTLLFLLRIYITRGWRSHFLTFVLMMTGTFSQNVDNYFWFRVGIRELFLPSMMVVHL